MFRLVLLLVSIAAACAACGLKGPLYLPENSLPVVIAPAADSASSASSSESSSVATTP